jgi:hypothetical protein
MIKLLQSRQSCVAVAALTGALVAGTALADDSQKLPGVDGDYRIAKPAPQPEPDDALPAGTNGSFKIGDTEVKIGGSVRFDMGVGGLKSTNH